MTAAQAFRSRLGEHGFECSVLRSPGPGPLAGRTAPRDTNLSSGRRRHPDRLWDAQKSEPVGLGAGPHGGLPDTFGQRTVLETDIKTPA